MAARQGEAGREALVGKAAVSPAGDLIQRLRRRARGKSRRRCVHGLQNWLMTLRGES
jgi:hypothetical protein